jgi:hypothetical protein
MSITERIPAPPKPRSVAPPGRARRIGESVTIKFVILGGFGAWLVGLFFWLAADDPDTTQLEAMHYYAATVGLAVVGAALLIVAAIFDSRD